MNLDLSLPRATLDKLIKDFLPSEMGCVKETKQVIMNCCIEFIHLITSEANDACEKQGKKTINGEHIISALQELGFAEFVPQVQATFEEFKNQTKLSSKKPKHSDKSDEVLHEEQLKLFEQSKAKLNHLQSPLPQEQEPIVDIMENDEDDMDQDE